MVTICTTRFNIHKFYVLPTQCINVFCVDLRTNSNYFPVPLICPAMNPHDAMVKRLLISRNPENQVGGSTATSRVSQPGQSKRVGTRRKAMFRARKLQHEFLRCRKRHRYRLEAQSKWCCRWFMIIQHTGVTRAGFNGRCTGMRRGNVNKTSSFKHAAWSKDSILCFWRRHIVCK